MKERKKRNQTPVIDAIKLEALVAMNYTDRQVAAAFDVDRKTLFNYRRDNAALEAAYQRGIQRRRPEGKAGLKPVSGADIGELLEHHLYDLLSDLNELRCTLLTPAEA